MIYTIIGRLVVWAGARFLKKKASANRAKLGAAAVVVAVLLVGLAAARGGDDS
jgi:hypothetical protein